MCICYRFNFGRLREEFWNTFFFVVIFYISIYIGILVAFQEGKPVNNFFICTKIDPSEFENVPRSIFHSAPAVFTCKRGTKTKNLKLNSYPSNFVLIHYTALPVTYLYTTFEILREKINMEDIDDNVSRITEVNSSEACYFVLIKF